MKVLLLAHFSAEATLISAADKDHERDNFSVFFSTEVRVVMCSNLRFPFSGFLPKCRKDSWLRISGQPSFQICQVFTMEAEAWREDSARRKERKVATLGRKFESFVVGKLRKSLGVWEGGWRGQKGTGLWVWLGGSTLGVTFLPRDITPLPTPRQPLPTLPPKKRQKKEVRAKIKELEIE